MTFDKVSGRERLGVLYSIKISRVESYWTLSTRRGHIITNNSNTTGSQLRENHRPVMRKTHQLILLWG